MAISGLSFVTRQPVWDELRGPLVNTLPMVALGTVLAIVLRPRRQECVAAWRRGTAADWGGVTSSLVFYSMPTQWLGLMLLIVFAGVLPAAGISDPFLEFEDPSWWQTVVDRLEHMILPALTLGLVLYGEYALIVRSAMLEALGEDYVMTARAKGFRNWTIVRRQALRNSLLPITTLIALSLGFLVGGAILVEAVFSYPGIGLVTYEAIFDRDYPVLQGAFLHPHAERGARQLRRGPPLLPARPADRNDMSVTPTTPDPIEGLASVLAPPRPTRRRIRALVLPLESERG